MPDLRISKPREDGWVLGLGPFCFRAMADVIQTDAQDFLRVWNDRQKLHLIDLKSWDRLRVGTLQLAQRTGGQHRSQVAVTRSQTAANIDDAAIVQEPIATRAVSLKCDDFHYSRLRRRVVGTKTHHRVDATGDHGDNSSRTRPLVSIANKRQMIPPTTRTIPNTTNT